MTGLDPNQIAAAHTGEHRCGDGLLWHPVAGECEPLQLANALTAANAALEAEREAHAQTKGQLRASSRNEVDGADREMRLRAEVRRLTAAQADPTPQWQHDNEEAAAADVHGGSR